MITMMNGDSLNHDVEKRCKTEFKKFLASAKRNLKICTDRVSNHKVQVLKIFCPIAGAVAFANEIMIYKTSQRRSAAYAVAKLNFTGLEIELDKWLMAEPLR
ncbi:hypothetical protein C5167_042724 [Papaver somniferum]|uniref:Uncharacterized protein n=1 Tax=Papaver somniferum TaxID=3469 RepID=A0A4Y7L7K4_PAPSO|nr:hypothetical protein C5167_042724 [Papaver somniferum]